MVRTVSQSAVTAIREFLKLESAGGMLLVGATILSMILANSPLGDMLGSILKARLTVTLEGFGIDKPLLLWINDGLMAIFFLLVGLELKREVVEGQLSSASQVVLPALAAVGGLAVPALVYWWVNAGDSAALSGWAIPTATDIAFALAVLTLLGSRVPLSLKIFLTTIAIIDDVAAIVIIAVFYTADLGLMELLGAVGGVVVLFIMNRMGVQKIAAYMLVGTTIWVMVLNSGVHATLAGVVVAAFIPLKADDDHSPARHLEHTLHPWVAFMILPVFAFANAGVPLGGSTGLSSLTHGVGLGVMLGLLLGKQLGVFGMIALATLTGIAKKPEGSTLLQLYGVSVLCGIGFTMSLFIGSLAFEYADFMFDYQLKMGVIFGSLGSAVLGYLVLYFALPKNRKVGPG
jgi:NhaA family Na+:H+ antiporter